MHRARIQALTQRWSAEVEQEAFCAGQSRGEQHKANAGNRLRTKHSAACVLTLDATELLAADGSSLWPQYQQSIAQLQLQPHALTTATLGVAASPLSSSASVASELKSAAWRHLHSGHWADVAPVWRKLYERAALVEVSLLCGVFANTPVQPLDSAQIAAALRSLDLALMMGSQDSDVAAAAHALVAFLESSDRNCSNPPTSMTSALPTEGSSSRKRTPDNDTHERASSSRGAAKSKTTQSADAPSANDAAETSAPASSLPCPPVLPSSPYARPLPRLTLPSLQSFQRACMIARTPTIICGAMDDWPAIRAPAAAASAAVSSSSSAAAPTIASDDHRWSNLDYLRRVCGRRTVPVELGADYMREEWSQQLMTVGEYMNTHMRDAQGEAKQDSTSQLPGLADSAVAAASSSSLPAVSPPVPVGYLAQHRLFDQIPALRNDIRVPDYCLMQMPGEHSDDPAPPQLHAWFGPRGTVSPLHFDPDHNLLAQVVGSKYVRLYAEELSDRLYPHAGALSNTSQIDVERMDAERFPKASTLEYWEGTLQGERTGAHTRAFCSFVFACSSADWCWRVACLCVRQLVSFCTFLLVAGTTYDRCLCHSPCPSGGVERNLRRSS